MTEDGRLVVYVQSRRFRRATAVFVPVAAVVGVVALVTRDWLILAGMVAVVLGPASTAWERVILDDGGLTIDEVVRRRHVPWSDVQGLRLHWSWSGSSPTFELELRGGGSTSAAAFGNLARHPRQPERRAVLERLRRESGRHGFALDVREPTEQRG